MLGGIAREALSGSERCNGFDSAISVVFGRACCRTRHATENIDLEHSVIYVLCLYRQDAAGDQLIGQLRHFRLQWNEGRGALEPLQRLVFWCGPR